MKKVSIGALIILAVVTVSGCNLEKTSITKKLFETTNYVTTTRTQVMPKSNLYTRLEIGSSFQEDYTKQPGYNDRDVEYIGNDNTLEETIYISSQENIEKFNLDKYFIEHSPNRELFPADENEYIKEIKKNGWRYFNTNQLEIWVQGLSTNLEGYESYAYVLQKNTPEEVLSVNWSFLNEKNKNKVEAQYEKFVKVLLTVSY